MAPVLIACPFGDWLVPTGQRASRVEDLEERYLLAHCLECGRAHEWTPADAVLAAASP